MLPLFDQVYNKFRDGFLRGTVVLPLILVTLSHLGAWGASEKGPSCGERLIGDQQSQRVTEAYESLSTRMNVGQRTLTRGQKSPSTVQSIRDAANRLIQALGLSTDDELPYVVLRAYDLANRLEAQNSADQGSLPIRPKREKLPWEVEIVHPKGSRSKILFEDRSTNGSLVKKVTEKARVNLVLSRGVEKLRFFGALYYIKLSTKSSPQWESQTNGEILTMNLIPNYGTDYPKRPLKSGIEELLARLQDISEDAPDGEIPVIIITDNPTDLLNSESGSQFLEAAIRQSLQNSP